ncbi:MAG: tRNA (adenosine(37)-N6)-threonylcarbamoyltransferase complex dimerization subunit type 1 TsaB [Pyramidobacter sp.]|jgi:tRNA threonylcarbamoyladenosine biosynthesis protein TsaB
MSEILLTVDCSNRWSCLGLAVDGEACGAINLDLGREQAARLPLVADDLLRGRGLKIADVTVLAVTTGPGYFTGIRIGMAYVAALAYALGIDVVPVSSLEVVLRSFPDWNSGLKVPLIAASREAAFSSAWLDGQPVLEEKERTREALLDALKPFPSSAELCSVRDKRLFAASSCEGVAFAEHPDGAAAALLAWEKRHLRIKPNMLRARYLREPGLGRSL